MQSTFNLETVNSLSGEQFEIRILSGDIGFVEIIQFIPEAPEYVNRSKGLFKAGFIIPDFDQHVAEWRENGVNFFGDGEAFYDEALGIHSIILLDPDGNRIQVFG